MIKARVLYFLWLGFTCLFWFWSESYLGFLLPLLSLALPILLLVLTRLHVGKLETSFSAGVTGVKHRFTRGRLYLNNKGFFPLPRVLCLLEGENFLTGEHFQTRIAAAAPAHAGVEVPVEFTSKYCGKLQVSLTGLEVYDPLGLFHFRVKAQGETVALFPPDIFPMETQILYGESLSLDSDMFSMSKAGSDSSETFAIREYRPGDRIRQIHWKLSEKLDLTMVREYGLPIQNTILLVLETGLPEGQDLPQPACMDALAEALFSLAESLTENQTVYSIAWYNHAHGELFCREVNDQGELMGLYPQVLSAVPGQDAYSVLSHYMEGHEQFEFAHVVVFSPQHREDLTTFDWAGLITEVVCQPQAAGSYQDQTIRVITTTPMTKEEDLVYLEI